MSQLEQISIVALILSIMPLAIKFLCRLHLFPIALCFASTKLFSPSWVSENRIAIVCALIVSGAYFLLRWLLWAVQKRRRRREQINHLLETAIPFYELEEFHKQA